MHTECELAQAPRRKGFIKLRCRIEHVLMDGADYDKPCPKCGQKASDREQEETEQIEAAPMEAVSCGA
jgi:hypothetical protein